MALLTPSQDLVAYTNKKRGWAVVGLCFAGFVVAQITSLIALGLAYSVSKSSFSFHDLALLDEPPWWWIFSSLVGLWCGFLVTTWFVNYRFHTINVPAAFRFKAVDLWFILLGPVLQIVVGIAYAPFHLKNFSKPVHHLLGNAAGWQLWLLGLCTVIGAPAVEELFFRGTLFIGLRDAMGSAALPVSAIGAVALDGLLFAMAHGELIQLPGLAFIGMSLAYIYWRTGRLWSSFMLHASFNALAFFVAIHHT